jgi:hypothetical protein
MFCLAINTSIQKLSYSMRAREHTLVFFLKHGTNVDTHTRMSTHHYEHMYAYSIYMSTFKILSRFDIEIHKVGH